jgi:hypothetical protein
VFCEGVQHRLRFGLDHHHCDKTGAFQFYLQSETQRKVAGGQVRRVGWVGDDSHVVFGQTFPCGQGSVRRYVVVMQQPFLLSPKFGAKSLHIFTQSP